MMHPEYHVVDAHLSPHEQGEVATLLDTHLRAAQQTGMYMHTWWMYACVHHPVMTHMTGMVPYIAVVTGN